jgi:hypothetical protein
VHTDRCGDISGRKRNEKGSRKEKKYKSVCTEIKRMWNVKCVITPVATGVTGMVIKGFKKSFCVLYQENTKTLHITLKVLQYET